MNYWPWWMQFATVVRGNVNWRNTTLNPVEGGCLSFRSSKDLLREMASRLKPLLDEIVFVGDAQRNSSSRIPPHLLFVRQMTLM